MFIDSHNHTCHFSGDAKMTAEELITAAAKAELSGIVITEHYDYDYAYDTLPPQIFSLPDFVEMVKILQQNHPEKPKIYLGIELGFQKHLVEYYNQLMNLYPLDSIICSNHLVLGKDPYFMRECYQLPKAKLYSTYIYELAEMVETFDNFDIVGHFDYLSRYAPYEDPSLRYKDMPEAFDRLFKAMSLKGKTLEINTRSIDKAQKLGLKDYWPDKEILQRFLEIGSGQICLGSDSHTDDTLGLLFTETAQYLKDCGFTHLTNYAQRQSFKTEL